MRAHLEVGLCDAAHGRQGADAHGEHDVLDRDVALVLMQQRRDCARGEARTRNRHPCAHARQATQTATNA